MRFRIAKHVQDMINDREIPGKLLRQVLDGPEQVVPASEGNLAYQSRVTIDGKEMLSRVIVDVYTEPPTAVTVYLTSKISKYWSES